VISWTKIKITAMLPYTNIPINTEYAETRFHFENTTGHWHAIKRLGMDWCLLPNHPTGRSFVLSSVLVLSEVSTKNDLQGAKVLFIEKLSTVTSFVMRGKAWKYIQD